MNPADFCDVEAHGVQVDALDLVRLGESDCVGVLKGLEILLDEALQLLLNIVEILLFCSFGSSRKLDKSVQPHILEIVLQTIVESRLDVFSPFAKNGILIIERLLFISF